ncbi:MAG: MFS transporter [Bacteroidales bacterium]|nr:MFS transporter [Bacteroidales bacterium]
MKESLKSVFPVLLALSAAHLLNDLMQATVASSYPMLKEDLGLSFAQIGSITFIYQIAASVFQPVVGHFFDRHKFPASIPLATTFSMLGVLGLAFSASLPMVYVSVFTIGLGSSILHPEASRITSLASGGKRGFAQSVFQVGGNLGSSAGPLAVALLVAPFGRARLWCFVFFSIASYMACVPITRWFSKYLSAGPVSGKKAEKRRRPLSMPATVGVIVLLCVLIISKYIYLESIKSYYTFYLIERFGLSISGSQLCLFAFLFATAAGIMLGGPLGDRIGRKYVIWFSILGTAPFSLLMPGASLPATVALSFGAGFILSSAFPSILLYAQELLPNNLGLVSGLFFGFAFGIGGIVSAVLGNFIDRDGVEAVYRFVSYTPLIGVLGGFLPDLRKRA